MADRQYPELNASDASLKPSRGLSFVIVYFCDEYHHNICKSDCLKNPANEVIVIDNRKDLFFENLSQAINAGIRQAKNNLIVVVHEDVLLVRGWQARLEKSLEALELHDANWGMVGAVGWTPSGTVAGHWSDPYEYRNTFGEIPFSEVKRLDEQLLIFRREIGLMCDENLPSIHNIGHDFSSILQERGLKTYAINAPTIHKYADSEGKIIQAAEDSLKITNRQLPTYKAEKANSDAYLFEKWPEWMPEGYEKTSLLSDTSNPAALNSDDPIVLISRGGSGSRLLSLLAQDLGIFIGSNLNSSGDCMDMVDSLYRGLLTKFRPTSKRQKQLAIPRICDAAFEMMKAAEYQSPWGFKLPENILLLPEIQAAFPRAKYIQLIRDPLATCLRRSHMTARFDNEIGRVTIPEAYRYCNRDVELSLTDPVEIRMAYTTIHQIETARNYLKRPEFNGFYEEIRFEDLMVWPNLTLQGTADRLGLTVCGDALTSTIDPKRAANAASEISENVVSEVRNILAPLRRELGYASSSGSV